jgi:hypothetical protein
LMNDSNLSYILPPQTFREMIFNEEKSHGAIKSAHAAVQQYWCQGSTWLRGR